MSGSDAAREVQELVVEEDLAVGDLTHACDDYCEALACGESERALEAQHARNRARVRLTTIHERLKRAVLEIAK